MATQASESEGTRRRLRGALLLALVGLVGVALGLLFDTRRALFAYLFAYSAALTVVLGALIFLMIAHVSHAKWPTVLRRPVEAVSASLPLLAVLFLPILLGAPHLFDWADPSHAPEHLREAIAHRRPYLNVPFFAVRAVIYFASWIGFSWRLRSFSLAQDLDGDPVWTRRSRRWSAVGLVVVAFTLTWASFDWLMSLTPDWQSSVFGLYVFSGGFVAFLGLLTLVMAGTVNGGPLTALLTKGHFLSVGKLLLSFVIFWVYMGYSQFFIIWIADVPAEVSWWVPRMHGWAAFSWLVVVGHFALPFFALLSRGLKMRPVGLAVVGGWVLVLHVLDAYWLVLPAHDESGPRLHWVDLAAVLLMTGACAALSLWQAARHPFVPARDPTYPASLEYEGT